jgi:XTP/dITP diphosphohydrolase
MPDLKITSLADYVSTPRIIENGRTFRENAVKKAVRVAHFTQKVTLGEDSGLCVDVLEGKPGVYSSRFSGKNKSDLKNNLKLLQLLEGAPLKERRAHYVCAVALADKDGLLGVVEGKCFGRVGFALKGKYGFGYDPLFIIPKYKKTFAELGPGIKHKMSHRFRALKKAKKLIQKYIEKHSGS